MSKNLEGFGLEDSGILVCLLLRVVLGAGRAEGGGRILSLLLGRCILA